MGCSNCYTGTAFDTATFDEHGRAYISPKHLRKINVFPGEFVVLSIETSKSRITLFSEDYFDAYCMKGNQRKFKVFTVEPSGALRISKKTLNEAAIFGGCFAKLKVVDNMEMAREEIRLYYGQ